MQTKWPPKGGFLMGVVMACKGCEERRDWIKQQYQLFKERLQLRKQRNTTVAHSDSGAEHNTDSAISTEGSGDTGSTGTEQ
ncbi:hypothetical protein [Acinetobacter baumannii]|uniref:hypothetical protein n=1 Tax=Acinetobacter baumannii TaxID=470 RepID=UPI0034CF1DB3